MKTSSEADLEKAIAILTKIVEIDPMHFGDWIGGDSEQICHFCGEPKHKKDCPWVRAKQLVEQEEG